MPFFCFKIWFLGKMKLTLHEIFLFIIGQCEFNGNNNV